MLELRSSVSKAFFCVPCSLFKLDHDCPDAGTNWRGSYVQGVSIAE